VKKKWIAIGTVMMLFLAANVAYATDGITILIHGKQIDSKEPVKLENGTTFVPLRVIAENLNQDVQWDSKTKTITVEQKEKPSSIERMVVQRDKDIFVSDNPENSEHYKEANQAFIYNLQTLYNETYRGLLSTDLDADTEIKTDKDLSFIQNSLASVEGSVESSFSYVRLVQTSYVRPSRKDILFYIDSKNPNDLYMAVQNPEKITEWKTYLVKDYGSWLEREIDIYLRGSRAL
jgi:hypothetical protein